MFPGDRKMPKVMDEALIPLYVDGKMVHLFSCSPFGLEELALGWLFEMQRISSADDVREIRVQSDRIDVATRSGLLPATTLAQAAEGLKDVRPWTEFSGDDARELLGRLFAAADTFGCHAVGGLAPNGELVVCEDIGRHNAMDKVAGVFLKRGDRPRALVSTGRLSLDMTVKASLIGASVVVTRKYPGTLSLGVMQRIGLRAFSGNGDEFTGL